MIEVTPSFSIPASELQFDYIRAAGPGGQNVNKVSSAVQLRFDIRNSPSLTDEVKQRLERLAGRRVTQDGILIIEARRFRTQEQNRLDAIQRLVLLVQNALLSPTKRKPTRPGVTARAARKAEKKRRAALKRTRRYVPEEWE